MASKKRKKLTKNAVLKDLRTAKYKQRVVPNKKKEPVLTLSEYEQLYDEVDECISAILGYVYKIDKLLSRKSLEKFKERKTLENASDTSDTSPPFSTSDDDEAKYSECYNPDTCGNTDKEDWKNSFKKAS